MIKAKYVTSIKDDRLHCIVWLGKKSKGKNHYFYLPEDTDQDELEAAVRAAVEIIKTGHVKVHGVDIEVKA